MADKWWYYLHSNGDVIGKNPAVVDSPYEYFDSTFVRKYWLIEDRRGLVVMLAELKEMGARPNRISEIETVNHITEADYERLRKEQGDEKT